MSEECPIDKTKLTMFNTYELQDGNICYDCADKIGLIKHDSHQSELLTKAAKSVITVNDAKKLVETNQIVDYEKLETKYKVDLDDNSKHIDSTKEAISDNKVDATAPSSTEKASVEPDETSNAPSDSTKETEESTSNPKFWKGDGFTGFITGAVLGLVAGTINMMFLHIWHLGIIVWIAVWLFMGLNPRFKDKRTPEEVAADVEAIKKDQADLKKAKNEKKETQRPVEINQTTIVEEPKKKVSRKAPHCPKCKSNNIQILDNKRGFSVGKTVAGALIFDGVGATVGAFAGKHGKKYHTVCMDCGKKFVIKL